MVEACYLIRGPTKKLVKLRKKCLNCEFRTYFLLMRLKFQPCGHLSYIELCTGDAGAAVSKLELYCADF